jgi:regulator of RNase E activity RraA
MHQRPRLLLLPLALLGLHAAVTPIAASTLRVPQDRGTIALALSLAASGDTILVSPGLYAENLTWPETQGLKLLSAEGPAGTIIDGGARDAVITILTGVDSTTVIRGFTLRNGYAWGT